MGGQARHRLTSDDPLVVEFIARHGVRRFERGASGDQFHLKAALIARGYEIEFGKFGQTVRLRAPGADEQIRTLSSEEFIALCDELRVADGLEPLVRR